MDPGLDPAINPDRLSPGALDRRYDAMFNHRLEDCGPLCTGHESHFQQSWQIPNGGVSMFDAGNVTGSSDPVESSPLPENLFEPPSTSATGPHDLPPSVPSSMSLGDDDEKGLSLSADVKSVCSSFVTESDNSGSVEAADDSDAASPSSRAKAEWSAEDDSKLLSLDPHETTRKEIARDFNSWRSTNGRPTLMYHQITHRLKMLGVPPRSSKWSDVEFAQLHKLLTNHPRPDDRKLLSTFNEWASENNFQTRTLEALRTQIRSSGPDCTRKRGYLQWCQRQEKMLIASTLHSYK